MKQTAVEWLVNEIPNIDWENSYWRNKIEQAKEMEKQQIIEAFDEGYFDEKTAERYYKDTFKNKEQ
jgi:hypothetical protein